MARNLASRDPCLSRTRRRPRRRVSNCFVLRPPGRVRLSPGRGSGRITSPRAAGRPPTSASTGEQLFGLGPPGRVRLSPGRGSGRITSPRAAGRGRRRPRRRVRGSSYRGSLEPPPHLARRPVGPQDTGHEDTRVGGEPGEARSVPLPDKTADVRVGSRATVLSWGPRGECGSPPAAVAAASPRPAQRGEVADVRVGGRGAARTEEAS